MPVEAAQVDVADDLASWTVELQPRPAGADRSTRSLTRAITKFMKKRDAKVRLHGLRHSHASHLLAQNIHPKIVQERFGHSSIAVTMDIYSHLMPNMQQDAAAKVDAALVEAINRARAK